MALLSELFVNAIWRGKQFEKGAKSSSKHVKAFEKTTKDLRSTLGVLRGGLAAVGVGLSVDYVKNVLQAQAVNARFADTLGVSVSRLEGYQDAARRFGINQEVMNDALLELSRRSAEAATGTGSMRETLDFLNIDVQKFLNMPLATRFELLANRMSKLDDSTRNFLADEAFGGASDAISGLLPNITKMADQFERAGLGTSPEAAARFKRLDEQIASLQSRLTLVGKQFLVDVSPTVIKALDQIEQLLSAGGGVVQRAQATREQFDASVTRALVGQNKETQQQFGQFLRLIGPQLSAAAALGSAFADPDRQILN